MNRVAVVAVLVAACGPKAVYQLSGANDNDRGALVAALQQRQLPEQAVPKNAARAPRVFVVQSGSPKAIVAFDLAAGAPLWKVDADVQSRIWVGGDFIVEVEGKELVARDQQHGTVRWKAGLPGEFVGAAADHDRAYAVWREGSSAKPEWNIAAFDGASGGQTWKHSSEGQLGAPAAQGGLVYSPYLTQWLTILDARDGKQLARLRGIDESISMLRVTSQVTYYGNKQGVYRLDTRSANGKKASSTWGQVKIPTQLDRTSYGRDIYDTVQSTYTAADRARVLWWSDPGGAEGPLHFANDSYAIHYFRFVFGFDMNGDMTWAYSNPRVELVASDDTGGAIVAVSQTGDVIALDPKTGGVMQKKSVGTTAPVIGATFDADGWSPSTQGEKVETVQALVQIAKDHDARFDKVKELAVASLSKLPGGEVTKELLTVLADKRAPQRLKDAVVDQLAKRKDPASLPVLTEQLKTKTDYLAKTEPEALGPVAKAIASLAGAKLDPATVGPALAALQVHLDAATTQAPDLVMVIDAMAAIGGGTERPALASHLLLYHADDELGNDPAWDKAIVIALHDHGGPGERELLRQVAADPRSRPNLLAAIKEAGD